MCRVYVFSSYRDGGFFVFVIAPLAISKSQSDFVFFLLPNAINVISLRSCDVCMWWKLCGRRRCTHRDPKRNDGN